MMKKSDTTKYILYARKSSESEDRQIQSIDDQINRLQRIARDLGLDVIDVMTESKSAKAPNSRPVFADMLRRIEAGEVTGILCWQINRLARNPVDSGAVAWFLQQGTLRAIQTSERTYLPDDNALLLSLESGMSTQFIVELRRNSKRGVASKVEKGWYPYLAPIGYLNDKINKIIIKDPERFGLVRKMWDMMLSGIQSPPQILDIANNQWGLRTQKMKKTGGTPLSRSGIYRLFTNPLYAGILKHDGKESVGRHEPMITLDEFDRVQFLLGRKGKPRPKKHAFAFTGLIRCGECGCMYTAETKRKQIKGTGEVREYTYYHCTRRKRDVMCSQRKALREDDLENQIADEISKFTILPEFRDWALEVLRSQHAKEVKDRSTIYESQHRALTKAQSNRDRLVSMRLNDLLSDEQFLEQRKRLDQEVATFQRQLRTTEDRATHWLELTEQAFDFATSAREVFLKGNLEAKKQILAALGSNQTIIDGKLTIHASEWLVPIAEAYPSLETEYNELEPAVLAP